MAPDPRVNPPEWWEWDLAFTSHVEARMEEREFSETELRTMIADATNITSSRRPGRFLARTRHGGALWAVVLEPDHG